MERSDERRDVEKRVQAELQVEAFMSLIQKRYDLKSEDIPEILDDLRWLRKHRAGLNRITWSVALGILAMAVAGMFSAMIEGFKHYIKGP